jgi:hypothetical protein
MRSFAFSMSCLVVVAIQVCEARVSDEQTLMSGLLTNYDSSSRPVFNASTIVTVKFGMSFIQICDMVQIFN